MDAKGNVYFADARENRIYRWSLENRRAERVRDIPQQPTQLAFDKAGNLLVVCYAGNGTVLAFRPDVNDSEIVTLTPQAHGTAPGNDRGPAGESVDGRRRVHARFDHAQAVPLPLARRHDLHSRRQGLHLPGP